MASAPYFTAPTSDQRLFEQTIAAMRADIANASVHMAIDGQARAIYDAKLRQMAEEIAGRASRGEITWRAAAAEAHEMRNITMELLRTQSTPVGRAYAVARKATGPDFNTIVAKKTGDLFGEKADFTRLSPAQQEEVFAAVVKSSGKSDPFITSVMPKVSVAGRALLVVAVAISVYTVATSDDPGKAAVKEGVTMGAGIVGGMASGALAGLVCGPGYPACAPIGAFVGGALAAFGASFMF